MAGEGSGSGRRQQQQQEEEQNPKKLLTMVESPPLSGLSVLKQEGEEEDEEVRVGQNISPSGIVSMGGENHSHLLFGEEGNHGHDPGASKPRESEREGEGQDDTLALCSSLNQVIGGPLLLKQEEGRECWSGEGEDDRTFGGQMLMGRVKTEMEELIDDVAFSMGAVDDVDTCSNVDADAHDILSWPDSALDFSLDSLGGGEVHDIELTDEDALLLGGMPLMGGEEREDNGELHMQSSGNGEEDSVSQSQDIGRLNSNGGEEENGGEDGTMKGSKSAPGRRKMKVDWTPELHRRFVQAVEQLGVEKAIPSRILELMGVQCLTRHNIASHLQKYRSHRRHLIAREAEAATWHQRRPLDPSAWSRMRRDGSSWVHPSHNAPPRIQPRPTLGLPPLQPLPPPMGHPMTHPCSHPPPPPAVGMPLYVWGHPTVDHSPAHMWQQPPPPTWYAPDGGMWQYPMTAVDASWGHPSTAVQGTPCFPQPMPRLMTAPPVVCGTMPCPSQSAQTTTSLPDLLSDDILNEPLYSGLGDDFDIFLDPGDDMFSTSGDVSRGILDEAISKALADPLMPLPLGLKPPSMEKVMAELQRQGITTAPSPLSLQQSAA